MKEEKKTNKKKNQKAKRNSPPQKQETNARERKNGFPLPGLSLASLVEIFGDRFPIHVNL